MSSYHAVPVVEPPDEHNRRLLANVHPPDWLNPEPPAKGYHLVVVGAGTAGLVAAAGAAGLGARVALIERHLMGGDCLNVGCVPSKGVIRAARAWHAVNKGQERFSAPAHVGTGEFSEAMRRMRRLRCSSVVRLCSAGSCCAWRRPPTGWTRRFFPAPSTRHRSCGHS